MLAHPLRNAEKAKKAKIPFDNHAKPLRKSKKNKKSKVFRRMQVGAYIWHFRMRFCFFSSGDDVGPTRGGLAYSYALPFLSDRHSLQKKV